MISISASREILELERMVAKPCADLLCSKVAEAIGVARLQDRSPRGVMKPKDPGRSVGQSLLVIRSYPGVSNRQRRAKGRVGAAAARNERSDKDSKETKRRNRVKQHSHKKGGDIKGAPGRRSKGMCREKRREKAAALLSGRRAAA